MPDTLVRTLTGGAANPVPCHIFPSADGAFFLAVNNDYQFAELSALAGQQQWKDDPRFASRHARYQHKAELTALLRRHTVEHRTEEWVAALRWHGVPCVALAPREAVG